MSTSRRQLRSSSSSSSSLAPPVNLVVALTTRSDVRPNLLSGEPSPVSHSNPPSLQATAGPLPSSSVGIPSPAVCLPAVRSSPAAVGDPTVAAVLSDGGALPSLMSTTTTPLSREEALMAEKLGLQAEIAAIKSSSSTSVSPKLPPVSSIEEELEEDGLIHSVQDAPQVFEKMAHRGKPTVTTSPPSFTDPVGKGEVSGSSAQILSCKNGSVTARNGKSAVNSVFSQEQFPPLPRYRKSNYKPTDTNIPTTTTPILAAGTNPMTPAETNLPADTNIHPPTLPLSKPLPSKFSWAQRVAAISKSTAVPRGVSFQFFEPIRQGEDVFVEAAIEQQESHPVWSSCLAGYFLGKRPPFTIVEAYAKKLWGRYGIVRTYLKEGFFLFHIPSDEDRRTILELGHWLFGNNPIVLQQWDPSLILKRNTKVTKLPVWVKIFDIPLAMWTNNGIARIASGVGRPLYGDATTEKFNGAAYARMCVEVEAEHKLPECIYLRYMGETLTCNLEYQWRPTQCTVCKVFGHACRAKEKTVEVHNNSKIVAEAEGEGVRSSTLVGAAVHDSEVCSSVPCGTVQETQDITAEQQFSAAGELHNSGVVQGSDPGSLGGSVSGQQVSGQLNSSMRTENSGVKTSGKQGDVHVEIAKEFVDPRSGRVDVNADTDRGSVSSLGLEDSFESLEEFELSPKQRRKEEKRAAKKELKKNKQQEEVNTASRRKKTSQSSRLVRP